MFKKLLAIILSLFVLAGCKDDSPWNNPHISENDPANTYYSTFSARPKTLDPAKAYSSDEYRFISQIYEPPLQYDLLKRPYQLTVLTASKMPQVNYFDENMHQVDSSQNAKFSEYTINIKPGIYYQPFPAFKKKRELIAADYTYEIKRLAHPNLGSPIFGLMAEHIVGLKDYAKKLRSENKKGFLDLRKYDFKGVKVTGRYQYKILVKGNYPQFMYWLAMPFFSPIPWEVDQYYSEFGKDDNNLSFDWMPVGTGAYYLKENNPNLQMVLVKNPNYKHERFKGNLLPFIDKFVFSLEKESIPRWNKFLQGYYDESGIAADSFDQAIRVGKDGTPYLSPFMKRMQIQLETAVEPSIFYFGFNMLDDVVGGDSDRAKNLRHAIAIALDYSEYISIFLNGRGVVANGPIPPGIFGFDQVGTKKVPIKKAYELMKAAGYEHGLDPKTGKALVLYYDTVGSGDPGQKSMFDWMHKQFAKLGIDLHVRVTQYNRFQQKMRSGNFQMYSWGWNADYPDPENFLFLFYGPNSKVKYGGENASNYISSKFDEYFEQMRSMPDNQERKDLIQKMVEILQKDQPWVWGFYPKQFVLAHQWVSTEPINPLVNNFMKYLKVNPKLRHKKQKEWNKPVIWPIWFLLAFVVIGVLPIFLKFYFFKIK